MNIIQAIVLGIVEGVTEFLPISSTFHLIFASKWLGLTDNDFLKLFEVFIQAGAILSVLILYLRELFKDKALMKLVAISFVPTGVIGFVLSKVLESLFESDVLMVGSFFIVGILFLLVEHNIKYARIDLSKGIRSLTIKEAVIIGLMQSIAIVPGVSRAGSVIVTMLFLGYKRSDAAKYSFMLSIPTIFAASFYYLFKMRHVLTEQSENSMLLLAGSISAFVTSYIVVKWLIDYLKNHTLKIFGWYRILLVIIILLGSYLLSL